MISLYLSCQLISAFVLPSGSGSAFSRRIKIRIQVVSHNSDPNGSGTEKLLVSNNVGSKTIF